MFVEKLRVKVHSLTRQRHIKPRQEKREKNRKPIMFGMQGIYKHLTWADIALLQVHTDQHFHYQLVSSPPWSLTTTRTPSFSPSRSYSQLWGTKSEPRATVRQRNYLVGQEHFIAHLLFQRGTVLIVQSLDNVSEKLLKTIERTVMKGAVNLRRHLQ